MTSLFDRIPYSAFVLGTNAVAVFASAFLAHVGWNLAN